MDDTVRENKQEQAITMLKMNQVEINRLPKKSDFEPYEISFIKSMLGPVASCPGSSRTETGQ